MIEAERYPTTRDGDGDIDCADIDCMEPNPVSCSQQGLLLIPCIPRLGDPAFIYLSQPDPRAVRNGTFSFHGRMVPTTDVNRSLEGFAVTLSNAEG